MEKVSFLTFCKSCPPNREAIFTKSQKLHFFHFLHFAKRERGGKIDKKSKTTKVHFFAFFNIALPIRFSIFAKSKKVHFFHFLHYAKIERVGKGGCGAVGRCGFGGSPLIGLL